MRRPLTTPNRLMAYAARLNGAKGAKLARAVAKQVRAKSGSVMETELAAIAFTAEVYGGLGIAEALINAPVAIVGGGAPGCSYRLGCARFLLAQGAFRH